MLPGESTGEMAESEARGIVMSEVVFRSAVEAGFRELRLYPFLLDYVFRTLVDDAGSARVYGQATADAAKRWFLKTNVEVIDADGLLPPTYPCVTLRLQGGGEGEATMGDQNYETVEDVDTEWPILVGPFDAVYNTVTGAIQVPAAVTGDLLVIPGMSLVDAAGRRAEILGTNADGVLVAPGTQLDLRGATIRGARPARVVGLESIKEEETWSVEAYTMGEPAHLKWLFAILRFVLYRNRKEFEARGLERASYTYGGIQRNDEIGPQPVWKREAVVRFTVHPCWPTVVYDKYQTVSPGLDIGKVGEASVDFVSAGEGTGWRVAD
jgi:hypothetical protein